MSRKSALNSAQKRTQHTLGRGVYLIMKRKDTPIAQLRVLIAQIRVNSEKNSALSKLVFEAFYLHTKNPNLSRARVTQKSTRTSIKLTSIKSLPQPKQAINI